MIVWIGGTQRAYRPPRPEPRRHVERVPSSDESHAVTDTEESAVGQAQEAIHAYQEPEPRQRRPVIRADQLMTEKIYTLSPDDSSDLARQILRDINTHHLPVIDEQQRLVGIVSDRDLLRAQLREAEEGPLKIAQIMTREVLAAKIDTPIREIAGTFAHQSIHAMPIIDDHHRLIGLITATDILAALVNRAPLDLWT